MTITETLKKTLDDLQLEQRAEALGQSVGDYVAAREDDISALVDKVATTLDSRTEGRFADEIGKVSATVRSAVARLAEQGPRRDA